MIKFLKKTLDEREKELFFGNLVTWGFLVFALVFAIAFAPFSTAERDGNTPTSRAEAAPLDIPSNRS